ncbi:hypothetical protein [Clostridium sp. AM58-1XD]|uniref:hypothetical protein n=1 Tax=Clostridium sp. AM58-1XD TaxID=2292307 RepID=UPI001FA8AF05|nr:hypothetical protein [Clostridium sp. AM58-1XD]
MANLNFELPAHVHGKKGAVRGTYEYYGFLKAFLENLPDELDVKRIYPEGIEVREPVETWSDDFSIAISGVPSMVNEFSAGSFMETHYHSQFDNDSYYDKDVYLFNHKLFGLLVMAFDELSVAPVNLKRLFQAVRRSVKPVTGKEDQEGLRRLMDRLDEAEIMGDRLYRRVTAVNRREEQISRGERMNLQRRLLRLFRKGQDSFVRLDWKDSVLFPQEAVQNNLRYLQKAEECLKQMDGEGALKAIYQIDNNSYAFQFDEEVFLHFTEYVLTQEKDRLQWGAGRIVHHENLFGVVAGLRNKVKHGQTDFTEERNILKAVEEKQQICYDDDIRYMVQAVDVMIDEMKKA